MTLLFSNKNIYYTHSFITCIYWMPHSLLCSIFIITQLEVLEFPLQFILRRRHAILSCIWVISFERYYFIQVFFQIYVHDYYFIYSHLASYTIILEPFSFLCSFLYGRSLSDKLFLFISKHRYFLLILEKIVGHISLWVDKCFLSNKCEGTIFNCLLSVVVRHLL